MLDNLKLLLGIEGSDLDNKLKLIISNTTSRLKMVIGGIDPPESMNHIILEVSIMRFNRIGSEGLSSHTVEGESLSFTGSDFDMFADDIQAFLATQKESKRGKVRFL